ncbi:hypothetical protein [Bdellovibrio sp. HCB2-146]|uniref:hypothetical protein n=1 Tax=Bdellovibrio sp. HCB2-146 TaxID=3394362 RepID=UPI0039BCCCF3
MLRSLVVFALTTGMAASSFAMDKAYFEIKNVKVTDVTEQQADLFAAKKVLPEDCNSQRPLRAVRSNEVKNNPAAGPLDVVEAVVDQIINIGKKIFAVIAQGKPVVNLQFDTANALPAGVQCWSDLSGWNAPASRVYNVVYENGLGMAVVDFTYRVTYVAGGSVDGVGQYITNATILPANLSVAWGFQFDATAQIPSVFNMGSKQEPLAGMQMNMAWKVTSPVAHEQSVESFHISGKNELVHMQ